MTPVNLGDLHSNEPVPTGLVQLKRGQIDGQSPFADWSYIYDGVGGPMQIAITTGNRPGWWVIRAETIFSIADAAWYFFHWFVRCSPVDENGWGDDHNYHRLHSALSWQQSCLDTAYRLKANTTYTATMFCAGRQAGTIYYWTGSTYHYIKGEFIAEGSL
jgi:hypothetical protein